MPTLGRLFVGLGLLMICMGGLLILFGKIPGVGRLPGDFLIQRKNVTFYFPLATSLIVSLILSFLLWLVRR